MKQLVVALLLVAVTAGYAQAVIDPDDDGIGIYFEPCAEINCVDLPVGEHQAYLVITHPTAPQGVLGWECSVTYEGPGFVLYYELLGNYINIGTLPEFIVGVAEPLINPYSYPAVPVAILHISVTDVADPIEFYVGNTYWPGADSPRGGTALELRPSPDRGIAVYAANNTLPGGIEPVDAGPARAVRPFPAPPVTAAAAELVLGRAGALPRDDLDRRLVEEAIARNGRIIDSPAEVGGWPVLAAGVPYPDADADGMDDEWEDSLGLDPADPEDRNLDRDGDGYTNLEAFLSELAARAG